MGACVSPPAHASPAAADSDNQVLCQLARLRRARLLAAIRIPTEGPSAVQLASRKWGLATSRCTVGHFSSRVADDGTT